MKKRFKQWLWVYLSLLFIVAIVSIGICTLIWLKLMKTSRGAYFSGFACIDDALGAWLLLFVQLSPVSQLVAINTLVGWNHQYHCWRSAVQSMMLMQHNKPEHVANGREERKNESNSQRIKISIQFIMLFERFIIDVHCFESERMKKTDEKQNIKQTGGKEITSCCKWWFLVSATGIDSFRIAFAAGYFTWRFALFNLIGKSCV